MSNDAKALITNVSHCPFKIAKLVTYHIYYILRLDSPIQNTPKNLQPSYIGCRGLTLIWRGKTHPFYPQRNSISVTGNSMKEILEKKEIIMDIPTILASEILPSVYLSDLCCPQDHYWKLMEYYSRKTSPISLLLSSFC